MAEPFMGQLLFAGFGFAPRQYANCDGAKLGISQYGALFTLLGKTFGGDGVTNFMLPDLRGRSPMGATPSIDANYLPPVTVLGQQQGAETVTLTTDQIPSHSHAINVSTSAGTSGSPNNRTFGQAANAMYGQPPGAGQAVALGGSPMTYVGGGGGHDNMQPFAVIEVAIALTGIFPSRP